MAEPPPEVLDCATEAAATNSLLGLRIGAIFAILAVSSVGVSLPLLSATLGRSWQSLFFIVRAIAGGVVLATGFVHVLGDAVPILSDPCLGLSSDYPWAFVFATFATLLTFVLELYLHRHFDKRLAHATSQLQDQSEACAERGGIGPVSHQGVDLDVSSAAKPSSALYIPDDPKEAELQRLRYTTASITFECGVIFHSIFIGITLGITADEDTARALLVALMFHQGCEGFALGSTFVLARYSTLKYCLLALAFVIITPLGIAIGTGVGASYQSQSKVALGFEGAFDSLSAGILIYNAIADLLLPTFERLPDSKVTQALSILGVFAGAAIMSLIAKWA